MKARSVSLLALAGPTVATIFVLKKSATIRFGSLRNCILVVLPWKLTKAVVKSWRRGRLGSADFN
jgi:hypothetical protein